MSDTTTDPAAAGVAGGPDGDPAEEGEAPGPPQDPPGTAAPVARDPLSWPARAVALVGWGVVVIGALGAADRISHFAFAIPWMRLGTWFAYSALFHDLLIAPVVTLVAILVGRWLPRLVRTPFAVGLIVSGSVVLMSYPRLRGYGALPGESSILPGNAARDLALVVALVWAAVGVWVAVRLVRRRTGSPAT